MNGRPATAYHVRDGRKRLKLKLLQIERGIKIFKHATSPAIIALDYFRYMVSKETQLV